MIPGIKERRKTIKIKRPTNREKRLKEYCLSKRYKQKIVEITRGLVDRSGNFSKRGFPSGLARAI
jgi:hypothetical protein